MKLDFERIAQAAGLKFNPEHRERIQAIADMHAHFINDPTRPPKDLRPLLKELSRSADQLVGALSYLDQGSSLMPPSDLSLAARAVLGRPGLLQTVPIIEVITWLRNFSTRASEISSIARKGGRPSGLEWPRKLLVIWLFGVWAEAGGKGWGCTSDGRGGSSGHEKKNKTSFLGMLEEVQQQTGDEGVRDPRTIMRILKKNCTDMRRPAREMTKTPPQ